MITTIKISDRVYILKDRYDSCANLILGSKRALLYDTGCGVDDMRTAVERITDLPLLVIASHGHNDHIGGSRFFPKVYLSGKDRNILDDFSDELLMRWVIDADKQRRKVSTDAGDSGDDTQYGLPEMPIKFGCGEWRQIAKLDFDRFSLGDIEGEIIELPGHSAGSVGVYLPKLRLLLSGDALAPIMCLIFKNHGSLEQELDTIRKAQDLDFDQYLSAHYDRLLDKDILRRIADCIETAGSRRFVKYTYPKPPYGEGYFTVHSLEDEPVGLIVENHCN